MNTHIRAIALLGISMSLYSTASMAQDTVAIPRQWHATGVPVSQTARAQSDAESEISFPSDDEWWREFNDSSLIRIISLAEQNNYTLAQASRRIDMAREQIRASQAAYYPTLGVSAGWNLAGQSGRTTSTPVPTSSLSYFNLGTQMSWEPDIFGRVRDQVRAGRLQVDISRADRAAALTSLCSQVALTYINLRMYQTELDVLANHIETQQKVQDIVEARYEAGLVSKLDVLQSQNVLTQTRLALPALEAQIEASINALATLCGTMSDDLSWLLQEAPLPSYRGYPAIGTPSDLLRRRPDVAAAQWQIDQLAAQLGVARKAYLPALSVQASAGTQAHRAGDLFGKESFTYLIAPTVSWTAFDGMARRAATAQAKLNMENAIDNYNAVILSAVEETNNALAQCRATLQQNVLTMQASDQSRQVFNLSLERYKLGLTDFTTVSQAIINLLQSENSLVQTKGAYLNSLITLYKALGGGYHN